MTALDTITLEWEGKSYVIAHDMRTIRQVERVLIRPEVREDLAANGVPCPTDVAEIYYNLLVLGGATGLTPMSVRFALFGADANPKDVVAAMEIVRRIMESRGAPPDIVDGETAPGNRVPAQVRS